MSPDLKKIALKKVVQIKLNTDVQLVFRRHSVTESLVEV